jgi:hypothetical protein
MIELIRPALEKKLIGRLLDFPKQELIAYGYVFFGGTYEGDAERRRLVSFWENDYKTKFCPHEIQKVYKDFVFQLTNKSLKEMIGIFFEDEPDTIFTSQQLI